MTEKFCRIHPIVLLTFLFFWHTEKVYDLIIIPCQYSRFLALLSALFPLTYPTDGWGVRAPRSVDFAQGYAAQGNHGTMDKKQEHDRYFNRTKKMLLVIAAQQRKMWRNGGTLLTMTSYQEGASSHRIYVTLFYFIPEGGLTSVFSCVFKKITLKKNRK